MQAVVVYESMFGNTHAVAQHIAEGIDAGATTTVVSVHDATPSMLAAADLVVVGGPTHVHGMSSKRSREGAVDQAAKDDGLDLDPEAFGDGLRDWFDDLETDAGGGKLAAAFDTRVHASTLITGRASKGITKRLQSHGFAMALDNESFFVDKSNHLENGEAERATEWGRALAASIQRAS